jgi:hypothetical protein
VACHAPVPLAAWYWTDHPSTLTGELPRLAISTKSRVYVAPELPPPP